MAYVFPLREYSMSLSQRRMTAPLPKRCTATEFPTVKTAPMKCTASVWIHRAMDVSLQYSFYSLTNQQRLYNSYFYWLNCWMFSLHQLWTWFATVYQAELTVRQDCRLFKRLRRDLRPVFFPPTFTVWILSNTRFAISRVYDLHKLPIIFFFSPTFNHY